LKKSVCTKMPATTRRSSQSATRQEPHAGAAMEGGAEVFMREA
jgi:hypothetical protein